MNNLLTLLFICIVLNSCNTRDNGRIDFTKTVLNLNLLERKTNGLILENKLIFTENDTINLLNIIHGQKKLLIIFPKFDCSVCIEEMFYEIKETFKSSENVIVIVSDSDKRLYQLFLSQFNIGMQTYYCGNDVFTTPIMELEVPYCFLLDSNLVISDCFVPIKEYSSYTKLNFDNYNKKLN